MFDVAVIGGGPAGSAAALSLARKGFSVALFDRSRAVRERLGETLPPDIRVPLEQLGVWDSFQRQGHRSISGIGSVWGSNQKSDTDFIFSPYGTGWVIDRRQFDFLLLEAAAQAGAHLFLCCNVQAVQDADNQSLITADRPQGDTIRLKSSFVVKATGRASSVGGLACGRKYADRSIALLRHFRSCRSPVAGRPLLEASKDGWWYSTLLPNDEFLAMYITDVSSVHGSIHHAPRVWMEALAHSAYTQERTMSCSEEAPIEVTLASCSRSRRMSDQRWLSVGDAALAFDPLCGLGILNALDSGIAGAEAIARWFERESLEPYDENLHRDFADHLELRRQYYGLENRWPDSLFWRRRSTLATINLNKEAA